MRGNSLTCTGHIDKINELALCYWVLQNNNYIIECFMSSVIYLYSLNNPSERSLQLIVHSMHVATINFWRQCSSNSSKKLFTFDVKNRRSNNMRKNEIIVSLRIKFLLP
uniref:Uncharacterized protein n=1 Tax=Heterorhabditis bacteriophora TaxID=37862 RepID=A0A1I7WE00_HETBA